MHMLNSEFQVILGDMTAAIAAGGTAITDKMKGGYDFSKDMRNLRRYCMDYFVAQRYRMNFDGSTTGINNTLTPAQFDLLMAKVMKYV